MGKQKMWYADTFLVPADTFLAVCRVFFLMSQTLLLPCSILAFKKSITSSTKNTHLPCPILIPFSPFSLKPANCC